MGMEGDGCRDMLKDRRDGERMRVMAVFGVTV